MYGDYHTHTTYSHGKGSVEDNVKAAIAAGLREIAITDHGPRHLLAGVKLRRIPDFLRDIRNMRDKYPQISILAGMECNFLSTRGEIDLPEECADELDIVVCGYHKGIRPLKVRDIGFFLGNLITKNGKRTLVRNTDAYVNAIMKNDIDILSHPMHDCRIDLDAVGRAAAEKGTLIELNGKRVSLKPEELVRLAELGCRFVMDSDAHTPERVGDVSCEKSVWEMSGLPEELITNLDGTPEFCGKRIKRADK